MDNKNSNSKRSKKMKKIICFALVLMALFTFVSCDDYYETHGYSKEEYDKVYEQIKKGY